MTTYKLVPVEPTEECPLVETLEEIIEWTSGDHPIATVAKRALEDYQQKGG